jgi:hypothetical protein
LQVMEKFRSCDTNAFSELLAISETLKTDSNELSWKESIKLLVTRQYRRPFLILNFLFILVSLKTLLAQKQIAKSQFMQLIEVYFLRLSK